MYDTLDSLLLNNSPKSMEMVSLSLSSKLEDLVARGNAADPVQEDQADQTASDEIQRDGSELKRAQG